MSRALVSSRWASGACSGCDGPRLVAGGLAGVEQRLRHRAIQQPGVEMTQAVMRGKLLADRALARRCRSVDRNDHRCSKIPTPVQTPAPGRGWSEAGKQV